MLNCELLLTLFIVHFREVVLDNDVKISHCNFTIDENQPTAMMVGHIPVLNAGEGHYQISERSPYFKVDKVNGWLQIKSVIDREYLCEHEKTCDCRSSEVKGTGERQCYLPLKVFHNPSGSESSGPPGILDLIVCIRDINDNAPEMSPRLTLDINENLPKGHLIPIKPATDLDAPSNSVHRYEIDCEEEAFDRFYDSKKNQLSLVVKKDLDREVRSSYDCKLQASDGKYTVKTQIQINILDVNDNDPVWTSKSVGGHFTETIAENTPPYSTIHRLLATDDDSMFGVVTYGLSSQAEERIHQMFTVNAQTGEVQTKAHLDYENKNGREFILPVVAMDNGSPNRRTATTTLTVKVTDVNDNSPSIKVQRKSERIKENEPPKFLQMIEVKDSDSKSNGKVKCRLEEGAQMFELKPHTAPNMYILNSIVAFDREVSSVVNVAIRCTDLGQPPQSQRVVITVHIEDENDSVPKFATEHFQVETTEGVPLGTSLFRATAIDPDINSPLHFSVNAEAKDFINIDQKSGEVYSVKNFDRETQDLYNFRVTVSDGVESHTRSANVTLKIRDINDNTPYFNSIYTFSVLENATQGSLVGTVSAKDTDNGANGSIVYRAADYTNSHLFMVHADGRVTLNRLLDRELRDNYELPVIASDKGSPRALSATTTVVINVQDVNDSPPRFSKPSYIRRVSCNQHYVTSGIVASDADMKPNNQIRYRLLRVMPNRTSPVFSVNPDTAEILMTNTEESCKRLGVRRLYISAYDPNKPEFSHNVTFTINLLRHEGGGVNGGFGGKGGNGGAAGDGTRGRKGGRKDMVSDTNLYIVVGLVCVSVLLAVLMLAIILYLKRRQDRDGGYEKGQTTPDPDDFHPGGSFPLSREGTIPLSLVPLCLDGTGGVATLERTAGGGYQDHYHKLGKGTIQSQSRSVENLYAGDCSGVFQMPNAKNTIKAWMECRDIDPNNKIPTYGNQTSDESSYHAYQTMLPTSSDKDGANSSDLLTHRAGGGGAYTSSSGEAGYTDFQHDNLIGGKKPTALNTPSNQRRPFGLQSSNHSTASMNRRAETLKKQGTHSGKPGASFTISFV